MDQLIVTGATPERLERARALQRKLLGLILAARTGLFELIRTPRESSISFKWRFTSPEYDGFPSEPDEVNEFHPLPQKMTIKWSLEDINKCNKAIDGGFISIKASSKAHRWTRLDVQKYTRIRLHDFIESSLGRSLNARPRWISPISNDERFNSYRWQFSETFSEFRQKPFSLWLSANYFELNNALDTGALTVFPIREYEASQNRISTRVCKPKAQVSIGQMSPSAVIPFHENGTQIPASEKVQCNKAATSFISGRLHEEHGTSDLILLCNQAWSHLENHYTTNDCKNNYARATLNIGLSLAIQLEDQIRRANALENENDRLNVQVLQLEHDQAMLQQEISNMREKDEKDVSSARLEGEKIAEENILRLWNSAKERGRVIGVCAMEKMFQRKNIPSDIISEVRNDLSTPSLVIPNSRIGGNQDSPNALQRIPPICADESRDRLFKLCALNSPLPSNLTGPAENAMASSNNLLPAVAAFESQKSHHKTAITNASVQIPPAPNAFHESFLNRILGPINRTLNIVPPSHTLSPVHWTRFFTINLDTQPYIFPLSTPIQTYGQIVHFVSQSTAESPRATQGTAYPTLLRLSQDTDEYYYIGHFVVSSVVTTTNFNQVLENLPDLSPNDRLTKHKLLKERNRALGSISGLADELPVDFYTLQYVFFGKEQYKILVDAKKTYDSMKAADHTIDLLIEADNQTDTSSTPSTTRDQANHPDYLSEPHNQNFAPPGLKFPTAPKAMRSDHSTIEDKTLSGSIHSDSIRSSLSRVHNIPTEPAAMRGDHLFSESGTLLESSLYNSIRSSLSQNVNIPKGPATMMRVYPPIPEIEVPSQTKSTRSSTISTNNSLENGTSDEPVVEGRSCTISGRNFPKNSNHHDIVSTPLAHLKDSHRTTATLKLKGTPTSGNKSESFETSNRHHATDSSFPSPRKNHEKLLQRKRKHTSDDENRIRGPETCDWIVVQKLSVSWHGIKPEHAVTTSVVRTATCRTSESAGGDKASKAASAAKGRRLNNTPKADPRLASRSNTSTAGHSSAQEKVNTPQAQSHAIPPPPKIMGNREDVESLPSIESSAGKRKRTISDLDALPQSERAIAEQKKRLKSEQSPQFDTMKQLWDRPRYAISVLEIPTVAEMLMSRKAAISTLEFDLNTVSIRKSLYSTANLLTLEE
ncbi:hypothetical protein BELL_0004g00010 [Botrytis elliptica]|uniref:Uncharacterized protein n=1 Tax=Botrytis elliptica TaxID=278938 RepID=A0A4Z1KGK9_9HELO|nr:hypothetical protein BELL_0004g00010 [Botrytis elliptica]